jgi:integrase
MIKWVLLAAITIVNEGRIMTQKRRGHGEGTITERGDGKWAAAMSIGNKKRRWFYGNSRREVQDKLKLALHEQQEGKLLPVSKRTVGKYLGEWLEQVRPTVRRRTYDSYALNVRRLAPYIGTIRLDALVAADIRKGYAALEKTGLSARSIQQAHTVLRTALRQAVRDGIIQRNPTDAISPPRPDGQEMQTLSQSEVQLLLTATADDRLHALWVVLVTTGLRSGEAVGLKWEDIDLEEGSLTVRRSIQRQVGIGLVEVPPKTKRSNRRVHLADGTVRTLREHRGRQKAEYLLTGRAWDSHCLVFCNQTGGMLDTGNVWESFQRRLRSAGLRKVRVHDLRHTAASYLLSQGVNIKVVQEMLGHSTVSTTLDIYGHTLPGMHKAAAGRMDAMFPPYDDDGVKHSA